MSIPFCFLFFTGCSSRVFFKGAKSFASRHDGLFKSSMLSWPDQKEIPLVLLALVGTAVRYAEAAVLYAHLLTAV